MESSQTQFDNNRRSNDLPLIEIKDGEIISIEECKNILGKFNLSDQRMVKIKDNLVGIVDSIFNSYLEGFK